MFSLIITCNLIIPPGFIVKTHEKAWMFDDLMKIWVEEIWLKYTQAECRSPGFQNSMLSFDDFTANLTGGVKNQLLEGNSNILAMSAGCTSKCQPMNVCLNKLFKTILRKCWVKMYVSSVVESFAEAYNNSSFKTLKHRYMIGWKRDLTILFSVQR